MNRPVNQQRAACWICEEERGGGGIGGSGTAIAVQVGSRHIAVSSLLRFGELQTPAAALLCRHLENSTPQTLRSLRPSTWLRQYLLLSRTDQGAAMLAGLSQRGAGGACVLLHRAAHLAPAGLATLAPALTTASTRLAALSADALPSTPASAFDAGSSLHSRRGDRRDVMAASSICRATYRHLNTTCPAGKAVADLNLPVREADPSQPDTPAAHPGSPSKGPTDEKSYLLMVRPHNTHTGRHVAHRRRTQSRSLPKRITTALPFICRCGVCTISPRTPAIPPAAPCVEHLRAIA